VSLSALPHITHALVSLLPVLCFLAGLLSLDSYKLIRPATVLGVIGAGVVAAAASYGLSHLALGPAGLGVAMYSQAVAPVSEELLKSLVIVLLVRSHRIGFLVDAAILGFAVGCGFAVVENLAYLRLAPQAELSTWIVRGFGTAVMHGGATAMLAVMGLSVLERKPGAGLAAFLPGLAVAAALHAGFNQLIAWPQLATLATLLLVPALLLAIFHLSERALADWLGSGFDADAQMLETIHSGNFAGSHAGRYLGTLKAVFSGEMMVDALCYLRLYTELALRAKGLLMLREHGLPEPPADDTLRSQLEELRYLESSLGATGLRALHPLLRMRRKDLWQINLLKSG
jgi:protease PrsW